MVDVEGIRPLSVQIAYAFEGQDSNKNIPGDVERERMAAIAGTFALEHYDTYSVMLDPFAAGFETRAQYMRRSLEMAPRYHMLFAIVTSEQDNDDWLKMQAGATVASGGELVVAYHRNVFGSSPILSSTATKVVAWKSIHGLRRTIREKICNNSTNDCNTKWTSQRKTA